MTPPCLPPGHAGRSLLEGARAEGVGVLVDRPLKACIEHRLVRLTEALVPEGGDDLDERLAQVAGLEAEYRRVVAPRLRTDEKSGLQSSHE